MFGINLKTKKSEKISGRITVEMTQWINACQMSLRTWVQILRVRAKVGCARLTCVIPELLHRDGKLLGQQACSTKQKATQRPCARQGGRWGPDPVSSSDLCEHTLEVKTKKTLTTNAVNHLSWVQLFCIWFVTAVSWKTMPRLPHMRSSPPFGKTGSDASNSQHYQYSFEQGYLGSPGIQASPGSNVWIGSDKTGMDVLSNRILEIFFFFFSFFFTLSYCVSRLLHGNRYLK